MAKKFNWDKKTKILADKIAPMIRRSEIDTILMDNLGISLYELKEALDEYEKNPNKQNRQARQNKPKNKQRDS